MCAMKTYEKPVLTKRERLSFVTAGPGPSVPPPPPPVP
ncbi:putative RiPP precursor [Mesorhizobium sp. B2-5-9]|nr:putative RiPP precursor [Mesorhizobium sp. B2-5-9]